MEFSSYLTLAGGLGMFLLGIHHLTEGLKGIAGDALRRALQKLVAGKCSALVSGAVFTALVQSSSAAILTVIGFVSAGLITSSQAVAVVLGANLGTTATSWLVAVFGFKVKIAAAALPMLGVGAFLWLLAQGRVRAIGGALAGFGLIFTGISFLQDGMVQVQWDLSGVGEGPAGAWLLAGLGVLMTIVMQSSSAAGATTLVALAAGTLTLDQAFAMVVGQNIGTTATAALAAIGGGLAVKRTALAHILFNLLVGTLALVLLEPLGTAARWLGSFVEPTGGVLTLATFHTLLNAAGILLFYPWIGAFARAIEWATGRGRISAVARLDPTLARASGPVALEAAWRALVDLSIAALHQLRTRLTSQPTDPTDLMPDWHVARSFIENLRFESTDPGTTTQRRVRLWHALDHLGRLLHDLAEPAPPVSAHPAAVSSTVNATDITTTEATRTAIDAIDTWTAAATQATSEPPTDPVATMESASHRLATSRKSARASLLEKVALGQWQPDQAMAELDHIRWIDSAFYHAWRLTHSLHAAASSPEPAKAANPPAANPPAERNQPPGEGAEVQIPTNEP